MTASSPTKQCPYCGESVHADAVKCKYCHEYFDEALRRARTEKPWNPGIAALLSFFIPGAGQIYKGDIARGIVILIVTIIGYMIFVVPGIAIHIWAVYTAYSALAPTDQKAPAKQKAQEPKTPKPRSAIQWFILVGGAVIVVLFVIALARIGLTQ